MAPVMRPEPRRDGPGAGEAEPAGAAAVPPALPGTPGTPGTGGPGLSAPCHCWHVCDSAALLHLPGQPPLSRGKEGNISIPRAWVDGCR